ncbi:type III secretion system export apparatus subunit SctT [Hyphomicrobium sp. MC1]|uniref:type III secretion system export apparatus subunit SctT n=1 Tax=Hyphomicrobium sp. (strain MC1) TaxID=717785 RepID=UPI000213EFD8|nr:type III secretion system export apparatus subunit SctT [Hyphomicrobium sp. MC1]CCB66677.1 Type III secretory pathway, component EscT [Hyphomicrobium sp. MC1]
MDRFADLLAGRDLSLLREFMVVGSIGIARLTAVFLITPFLGKGVLTGLARNGVLVALALPALVLVFNTRPTNLAELNLFAVLALVLKETLLGVMIGMPFAVLSWGIEGAGFMIDNQRGSTMASSMDPATGNQSSPLGILLAQLYTVWMFAAGGFLLLLDLLYRSFTLWPVWDMLPQFNSGLVPETLAMLDRVMLLTLLISGPALMAMFLSEMGLALTSRFAPQLQVFFMAMPVKSAVGIFVLILSLGAIMHGLTQRLAEQAGSLTLLRGWLQ